MDHKSEQRLWEDLHDLAMAADTDGLNDLIETLPPEEATDLI